ncbi:MAG: hypothetical protein NUW07_05070 [Candidatus Saccharicenans sp.]|nr:hypothetical protein [Candidatus Saccharicenans sp.]MDH7492818.1 hypothetical protein [Candidatus Saccharicenans sp.]
MKKAIRTTPLLIIMVCLMAWPLLARAADTHSGQTSGPGAAVFKIPFEFKAAGKKIPAGEYWFGFNQAGKLILRQTASGKELELQVLEKLSPPEQPPAEPRLVFDEVGDFAPSYTEYFTVYVLSEIWLSGQDGFLVHITKSQHKEKTVTGTAVK